MSGPLLWDGGLFMQHAPEQVRKLTPEPFVALNPADLAAAKLAEGSQVTVTSPHGSATLTLKADASVQPGTAWIPDRPGGSARRDAWRGAGRDCACRSAIA